MNIPRCSEHRTIPYARPDCDGCRDEAAALQAIARRRDRVPRTLAKKSRAFHAAGGGTEQFSLAAYDRLMSETHGTEEAT